jgi:hypothetical protein
VLCAVTILSADLRSLKKKIYNFIIFAKYYLDALKQIEIAGACVLRGRQKKCVLVFGGK